MGLMVFQLNLISPCDTKDYILKTKCKSLKLHFYKHMYLNHLPFHYSQFYEWNCYYKLHKIFAEFKGNYFLHKKYCLNSQNIHEFIWIVIIPSFLLSKGIYQLRSKIDVCSWSIKLKMFPHFEEIFITM